jgi:hydrogenase nickel incorporation protein HypA/HybF
VHELSVSAAVVDTAVRHAAGRKVTVVNLRVGALRQVVPDSLAFYFEIVARDTLCEGAALEQELIGARLRCESCEMEWEVDAPAFRCPGCAGGAVTVVCGDELEVESIDVEQQEPACTV